MAETEHPEAPLWGVSAEFEGPEGLVQAARILQKSGFGRMDSFSPVPVPEMDGVLRSRMLPMWLFAVLGVLAGGLGVFAMCVYATVYDYPFNIGGRPPFSWPSFIIPSFSFAMAAGAVVALLAFLMSSRLPRLNHPAFNIPGFTRATQDRFFLVIEAPEADFKPEAVERVLGRLALPPLAVNRVPR